MSLYKRSNIWWYSFEFKGRTYVGSTYQRNRNKAVLVEAKVRSDAGLEAHGIVLPKTSPWFRDFLNNDFLPHVRRNSVDKPQTIRFYESRTKRLLEFLPFAEARLTAIDQALIAQYTDHRLKSPRRSRGPGKVAATSVGREIAVLQRALNLADEWKLIPKAPRLHPAGSGERKFVVSGELERAYFAVAEYPLKHAATLVCDFGLRPDECVNLLKTDIRDGCLQVRQGKTDNAARTFPLTTRAKVLLDELFALWPNAPWVFPGKLPDSHLTGSALGKAHARLRTAQGWPAEFALYSFRHTFGTRLAESGASPFAIKALMGHSDVRVSQKYIHLTPEHLIVAMKQKEAFDKILRGEMETHENNLPVSR